jgi:hypothetical protein
MNCRAVESQKISYTFLMFVKNFDLIAHVITVVLMQFNHEFGYNITIRGYNITS